MNQTNYTHQACCIALHLMQGLGPTSKIKLLDRCPDLTQLFFQPPEALREQGFHLGFIQALGKVDWRPVEQALAWQVAHTKHHIVHYGSEQYPDALASLNDAPVVLYAIGDIDLLHQSQMAMVGSRKPTPAGLKTATAWAQQLAQAGLTITSGMALGIDGAAHQGVLAAGKPTVAVLGSGVDVIYPRRHRALYEHIVGQGLVLSEQALGTQPVGAYFPQRNRIISGLSLGVLVVEASLRSGSLCTARLANEQGREVFTVPGSIYSAQSQGCHALLKQGAQCVTCVEDILDAWPDYAKPDKSQSPQQKPHPLEPMEKKVYASIGYEVTLLDNILENTQFNLGQVQSLLLELELKKLIIPYGAGFMRV